MQDIPPPKRRIEVPPVAQPATAPAWQEYFDSRARQAARHAAPPSLDIAVSAG